MTPRPPFVDAHEVRVAAAPPAVWVALGASLRASAVGRAGSALLGTEPRRAAGDPLQDGSTIPGFAVRAAEAAERLELVGRHRFSRYELVFTLTPTADGTALRALTFATFPGLRGALYRAAVIGSGAHVVLVRRWLDRIRTSAEGAG